jgi:hypothetical protein
MCVSSCALAGIARASPSCTSADARAIVLSMALHPIQSCLGVRRWAKSPGRARTVGFPRAVVQGAVVQEAVACSC